MRVESRTRIAYNRKRAPIPKTKRKPARRPAPRKQSATSRATINALHQRAMPLIGLAVYLISIRHCNTWTLAPSPLSRKPARERMGVQKANPKHSLITAWFTKSSTRGAAMMVQTGGQLSKTRRIIEQKSPWHKLRWIRSRGGITPRRTSPRIGLIHGFRTRKRLATIKEINRLKKCCRSQSSWLIHNGSDPLINSKGWWQLCKTNVNRAAQAWSKPKEAACSCKTIQSLTR